MKRLLILCAILFIGVWSNSKAENLDSLNQYTGWDYSGDIRVQKLKTAGYTYSQLMENGNELFTADSAGYIRIWNLETGKLIYSKKIKYSQIIANYKNDIVYYLENSFTDRLYGFNIRTDSVLFEYYAYLPMHSSAKYSFHKKNRILIPYRKFEYVNYVTDHPYYHKYWYETKVFDCDSLLIKKTPDIPFGHGFDFIYPKTDTNLCIYSMHRWAVNDDSTKNEYTYDNYYCAIINNCEPYGHVAKDTLFNNSFSSSDRYIISIYGRSLRVYDLSIKTGNGFFMNSLDYSANKFVVDKKDRIIALNPAGDKLIVGSWKASVSAELIGMPEKLGDSRLVLNSDSSALIVAGGTGKIVYLPLNIKSKICIGLEANRTNINVGDQVNFTSKSTGVICDFKVLMGDGGEISDYNLKYIFKKAGDFDVTVIANDGVDYDTVVYRKMIHVEQKENQKFASFSEDKRFGFFPLTVKFANTTPGAYTFLEWNFGDGTTSQQISPSHSFYRYGKHVVTLTVIVAGETLRVSKDFNVITNQLTNIRNGGGDYTKSPTNSTYWRTDSDYENLLVLENDKFYFTENTDGWKEEPSRIKASFRDTLKFYNGWSLPFKLGNPPLSTEAYKSYKAYIDGGIVTDKGLVYNNEGKVLFQTEKITPGTILPDRNRDSLISYDDNKLYYCDQYFEPLWNIDFYELTGDSCNVLNVTSLYNGNIAIFLYFKQSSKVERYEIDPLSGQVVQNSLFSNAIKTPMYHLNDILYFTKIGQDLVSFDSSGNELNRVNIGKKSPYILDSTLIMLAIKRDSVLKFDFYDCNLKYISSYTNHQVRPSRWSYDDLAAFMLNDKSVILLRNEYNGYYRMFSMERYFFPEIYTKGNTSAPEPIPGESLTEAYPNPAHNEITISVNEDTECDKIEITEINGNMCDFAIKQSVGNRFVLDISKLASGTYYYRIISNDKQIKGRFVKE